MHQTKKKKPSNQPHRHHLIPPPRPSQAGGNHMASLRAIRRDAIFLCEFAFSECGVQVILLARICFSHSHIQLITRTVCYRARCHMNFHRWYSKVAAKQTHSSPVPGPIQHHPEEMEVLNNPDKTHITHIQYNTNTTQLLLTIKTASTAIVHPIYTHLRITRPGCIDSLRIIRFRIAPCPWPCFPPCPCPLLLTRWSLYLFSPCWHHPHVPPE
ncbi:hypothetical protein J3F83DRAFT_743173 [Trichoderma novae-zelandiae]